MSSAKTDLAVAVAESIWTLDQIELIKSMCVPPSATDDEFKVMLYTAQKYSLDPLVKQIYMQKFRKGQGYAPATIMVTYAGMQEIANRGNLLDGISAEPFFEGNKLMGAKSTLWKKDHAHPFQVVVYFSEYVQMYDGKPSGLWGTKPVTMICKVSNAQNLRQAFSLGPMYTEEEIGPEPDALPAATQTRAVEAPHVVQEVMYTGFVGMDTPTEPEAKKLIESAEHLSEQLLRAVDEVIVERIERAADIYTATNLTTIYDTRGTWLEITVDQAEAAIQKITGAASIQAASNLMGIEKFGEILKVNFPDAQKPRTKGGPAQQYSALVHFVHDWKMREIAHRNDRVAAIESFGMDIGATV